MILTISNPQHVLVGDIINVSISGSTDGERFMIRSIDSVTTITIEPKLGWWIRIKQWFKKLFGVK